MSGLDSLYQELILDHSKHPVGSPLHDAGAAAHADSHQKNPVCGDEVTLRVAVDGDRVVDVSWEGTGCSISQASASMLATLVEEALEDGDGMTRAEARALIDGFREALRSRGTIPLDEETFGDAAALSGVSKFSARVKCAMLAWVALEDGLARA